MQYRKDKYGNPLSILGYGCMRFTTRNGKIDLEKTEQEIMEAYHNGVNYFDTAYAYPGSEAALGTIVEKNKIRDKINIATKLPQYLISNASMLDKYFNEELERLRTDHVDYYLMHHMTDYLQWERLKKVGIIDWINEKKEKGVIRNIGFSYHGNSEMFIRILDDYPWDFAQVQYNYLDENTQAGRAGVEHARDADIPIVIMEPLRGGKLVNLLPEKAKDLIRNNQRGYSPAEWGLRWLYDQEAVTVVLSGMNSLEMVKENCRVASEAEANSFDDDDRELIRSVVDEIKAHEKVGCTGCRYCMPCPRGIDIPGIFNAYNRMYTESKFDGRFQYAQTVALRKDAAFATACVRCGKCESHCPQSIPIREKLVEADKALRPLPYKIGINAVRAFMFRKTKEKTNR
jgi:predicted aldo/keto reductase-like oxidoreductase